ncbi:DUF4124 domain-containing protein [Thaumasiovibrio subtropicus]|uniref:DUF4124 domain-containing protein n=1 Tax=Thaumasiovibrio subtropicus TaxID=1891207 RepID=UPI000B3624DB|nr:DUF4124 domain-containing protein [Thaumasiovibrio subtropicus]
MKMIKIGTTLIALTLMPVAVATTIYSWKDANGKTVFSDHPPESGQYDQQHYDDPPPPPPVLDAEAEPLPQPSAEPELKNPPPSKVSLLTPNHEQTVRDNAGRLSVSVSTDTPLREHYQVQLYVAGQPFGPRSSVNQWQVENVDRGAHELSVKLLKNGKIIASTSPVTVFMHRASKGQLPSLPKVGQPPAEAL